MVNSHFSFWSLQLVEFLHHGNTQIRQIGNRKLISTWFLYWLDISLLLSMRESRWFFDSTTEPFQAPSTSASARLEASGSWLYSKYPGPRMRCLSSSDYFDYIANREKCTDNPHQPLRWRGSVGTSRQRRCIHWNPPCQTDSECLPDVISSTHVLTHYRMWRNPMQMRLRCSSPISSSRMT